MSTSETILKHSRSVKRVKEPCKFNLSFWRCLVMRQQLSKDGKLDTVAENAKRVFTAFYGKKPDASYAGVQRDELPKIEAKTGYRINIYFIGTDSKLVSLLVSASEGEDVNLLLEGLNQYSLITKLDVLSDEKKQCEISRKELWRTYAARVVKEQRTLKYPPTRAALIQELDSLNKAK